MLKKLSMLGLPSLGRMLRSLLNKFRALKLLYFLEKEKQT